MQVHLISDISRSGEAAFEELLGRLRINGPDFFQIREKEESDRSVYDRTVRARASLPKSTAVLVNGRPDLAVASGAQGVQLPADGLPLGEVRRFFPAPFLIGVSCHSLESVSRASGGGADFVLLSPLYAPSSKESTGAPLGPETLDRLPAPPPIPVHALGGITLARVASWPVERRRKVAGVAGISLLAGARRNEGALIEAFHALEGAGSP